MSGTESPTEEEERAVDVQRMLQDIEQKDQRMRTEWFKTMAVVIGASAALFTAFGTVLGTWIAHSLGSH